MTNQVSDQMSMTKASRTKMDFFDNIRFFIVLMVVVIHAVHPYSYACDSWYYIMNGEKSVLVDIFLGWAQTWAMPILFFVSGYFAVSPFLKKGITHTLKNKLRRLGAPLVFGAFFLVPILHYITNFRKGAHYDISYGRYLLLKPHSRIWAMAPS